MNFGTISSLVAKLFVVSTAIVLGVTFAIREIYGRGGGGGGGGHITKTKEGGGGRVGGGGGGGGGEGVNSKKLR